ncbi:uncharacterized protein K441DRAFT_460557, partial [Cenococcum geophilum 1.58]|uniref:uncharacterized protein n=1 Tax=Cenococcum geophilum 1.58 TaxID=794803 RepID=UPI00358E3C05
NAICINQADGGEKIREILRIKDIYGGSMGVFVHLGPEEDDSDYGIDILQRTATESRVKPTEADRKDFGALMKVLCRPYWCRLWILQELAISDESI